MLKIETKLMPRGDSFQIPIPKAFLKTKVLKLGQQYMVTIEEIEPQNIKELSQPTGSHVKSLLSRLEHVMSVECCAALI